MTIEERINADYIMAMKAHEADKVGTLRLLMSALKNEAIKIGGVGTVLTDTQALAVLSRETKQRHDAITQYEAAGRSELAAKERAELALIETFMPQAMDATELQTLVETIIASSGATQKSDMGKVMAELKQKLANPADTAKAAAIVNQKLA